MVASSFSISEEDGALMEGAASAYVDRLLEIVGDKTPEGWPVGAFRASLATRLLVTVICLPEAHDDRELVLGAAAGLAQVVGMMPEPRERAAFMNEMIQQFVSTIAAVSSLTEPKGRLQ